uniref:Pentatricopeptide repeat-containing protein n=1 Tax=Cucumis melo TaxID=3656 RepID=A0A9I9DB46_CUCME
MVTFTMLIDTLYKEGKLIEAQKLLEVMIQRGIFPDSCTYNSLMEGFCMVDDLNSARELFLNTISYTIVVDMLCKDEKYRECLDLFPRFSVQKHQIDIECSFESPLNFQA